MLIDEQRVRLPSVPHVSPAEWDARLLELTTSSGDNDNRKKVVLLDCRNSYESAVGYFQARVRPLC